MKLLGKGKTGKAYLLENGNVLKVTSDKDEFEIALKIIKEKPKWSSRIIKAEKQQRKYYIEKAFVNPIFPKADKKGSMNYGDARFEFTGQQFLQYPKMLDKIKKISKILNSKIIVQGTVCTVKNAFSPYNLCRPKEWGNVFEIKKFNPVSISKIIYENSNDRKIYEWFVPAFFEAKKFGAYTGDLYQNIGKKGNGQLCFFDVM